MAKSNLTGGWKHAAHGAWMKVRETITPVPTTSQFKEKRVRDWANLVLQICTLTPAEFVQAGNYLVQTYPMWEWYGGVASKQKTYLGGPGKQCLVIRKVPANPVVQLNSGNLEEHDELDDDWVCPGTVSEEQPQAPDVDIPDAMIDDMDADADEEDVAALPTQSQNRRLYDLYITYDLVYKVPRFWLVGYDADLNLLPSEEIYGDVSKEHAGLTLTWDPHPHEVFHAVSIHPCQHAKVMKELLDAMEAGGRSIAIDHYLLVFLKFITALIPTIEYDYTLSI